MEALTEMWGMSLNQTILLVAAILVVVDFFIPSEAPTHFAYILLCALVAINIDAHILIKILCALLAWFALVAFHYCFWRATVQKFVNTVIAPDRFRPGADGTVGDAGVISDVDGNKMVRVKGDLWPCHGADSLSDGTRVTVVSAKDGILGCLHDRKTR
jgi:membrane protein implicated in regulation of membrane protease activity